MRIALLGAIALLSGHIYTIEVMADQANSLKVIPSAGNAVSSLIEVDTAQRVCRRALTWNRDSWESELTSEVKEAKKIGLSVEDCKQILILLAESSATLENKRKANDQLAVQLERSHGSTKETSRLPVLVDVISADTETGRRLILINRGEKGSALGSTLYPAEALEPKNAERQTPSVSNSVLPAKDSGGLEERIAALESRLSHPVLITSSDRIVCKTALDNSGLHWESGPDFKDTIKEVNNRRLTVEQCRALLKIEAVSGTDGDEVLSLAGDQAGKASADGKVTDGGNDMERILSVEEVIPPPKPRARPTDYVVDGTLDGVDGAEAPLDRSKVRIKNTGTRVIPEVELAESDPTTAVLPSSAAGDENIQEKQPRRSAEPEHNLGYLSYAGQAYASVPIVRKSGIGTRKAIIVVKPSLNDAISSCAEVFSKDTPRADILNCGRENFSEQKRLRKAVHADCKNRTWTDLYGNNFALLGKMKNFEGSEKYRIVERSSGERLIATPYFTALSVFVDLCPGVLPNHGW